MLHWRNHRTNSYWVTRTKQDYKSEIDTILGRGRGRRLDWDWDWY